MTTLVDEPLGEPRPARVLQLGQLGLGVPHRLDDGGHGLGEPARQGGDRPVRTSTVEDGSADLNEFLAHTIGRDPHVLSQLVAGGPTQPGNPCPGA